MTYDSASAHGRVTMCRLSLTGVIGPVLSVVVFTVAGMLRPGYSPVHQAISALGNGTGGLLIDAAGVLMGAGTRGTTPGTRRSATDSSEARSHR
ncbi:DUF998 domain-containing protein [Microbispora sp. RL4-1S]|uniref:DUF998 domain-containing protein n=1 Tax=Microbispora oryzae TaxID=2806554 RepID=A0A940WWI2_9ACTN|nr:DUF998 domain-containing protein [Microbispora oryzae]MBP2708219.1 DUF998 domain-containing protein [Microbispora oryzae]